MNLCTMQKIHRCKMLTNFTHSCTKNLRAINYYKLQLKFVLCGEMFTIKSVCGDRLPKMYKPFVCEYSSLCHIIEIYNIILSTVKQRGDFFLQVWFIFLHCSVGFETCVEIQEEWNVWG